MIEKLKYFILVFGYKSINNLSMILNYCANIRNHFHIRLSLFLHYTSLKTVVIELIGFTFESSFNCFEIIKRRISLNYCNSD